MNPRVLAALTPPPASMREVAERYGKLLRRSRSPVAVGLRRGPRGRQSAEPPQLESTAGGSAAAMPVWGRFALPGAGRSADRRSELFFDNPTLDRAVEIAGRGRSLADRLAAVATAMPCRWSIGSRIRPARVFRRGNPANRGPEVQRHFVSVVAGADPPPFTHGSGRLELAQAIVDPGNPLTARVWVNRVWQHHFGAGLVRTASDFGVRAEPPSHPELLDWLATRLIDGGWSTKNLHRLILLSSDLSAAVATARPTMRGARAGQPSRSRESAAVADERPPADVRGISRQPAGDRRAARPGHGRPAGPTCLRPAARPIGGGRCMAWSIGSSCPATFRVFDFANPDLHIPLRSRNDRAAAGPVRAESSVCRATGARPWPPGSAATDVSDPAEIVRRLYRAVVSSASRPPAQLAAALAFVSAEPCPQPADPAAGDAGLAIWLWRIGPGDGQTLKDFHALPYFSGSAWQGGPHWPDANLGWVQLTAQGGHPGNDLQHCCRPPLGGPPRRHVFDQLGPDP